MLDLVFDQTQRSLNVDYLDKQVEHGFTFQCRGAEKGDTGMVQVLSAA